MSADRLGEIAPMTDEHLVEIDAQMKRMGGVLVQGYEWRRLKARLDRAEAALATADAAGFARGVEAASAEVDGLWSNGSTPYARGRREMKIAAIDAIRALAARNTDPEVPHA